jgi:hypothetical protein
MEARFACDFDQVRIHSDTEAARSAKALGAAAYTVGEHVVFGAGRYATDSPAGERLLAHELAHVVQQSRGGSAPAPDSFASHEQDAARAAESVVSRAGPVAVGGATGVGLACALEPGTPEPPAMQAHLSNLEAYLQTVITNAPASTRPAGSRMFAVAILVGADGTELGRAWGEDRGAPDHAEIVATSQLRDMAGQGDTLLVFVEAQPCPENCRPKMFGLKRAMANRGAGLMVFSRYLTVGTTTDSQGQSRGVVDDRPRTATRTNPARQMLEDVAFHQEPTVRQAPQRPPTSGTPPSSGPGGPRGSSGGQSASGSSGAASSGTGSTRQQSPESEGASGAQQASGSSSSATQSPASGQGGQQPASQQPASQQPASQQPANKAPAQQGGSPSSQKTPSGAKPPSGRAPSADRGTPAAVEARGAALGGGIVLAHAIIRGGLELISDREARRAAEEDFNKQEPEILKALRTSKGMGAGVQFTLARRAHPNPDMAGTTKFVQTDWELMSVNKGAIRVIAPRSADPEVSQFAIYRWIPPLPASELVEEPQAKAARTKEAGRVTTRERFIELVHPDKSLRSQLAAYEGLIKARALEAPYDGYRVEVNNVAVSVPSSLHRELVAGHERLLTDGLQRRLSRLEAEVNEGLRRIDEPRVNRNLVYDARAHMTAARGAITQKRFRDAYDSIRSGEASMNRVGARFLEES